MSSLPPRQPATIADVAQAAGVSRAAVSKVIRNAYGVSPGMRERVNAAIEALNYRPRVAARAMRGSSFTLGIELPDFRNQFFTRVLEGAAAALEGTGYQLIFAPASGDKGRGHRAVEALLDQQVDGIITVSPLVERSWLEDIAQDKPLVMFGRHDWSDRYDAVAGDDSAGARLVMDHLLAAGHTNITHVTLSEEATGGSRMTPHALRLDVYLSAMRDAGLADHIDVVRVNDGQQFSYSVLSQHLASGASPTAIFAAHDELAFGAMRAVADDGRSIAIVGYDNVPMASLPAVSLSSVDQPGELMGARAVELLLERFQGRTAPVHELFTPSLLVRGSSQPEALGSAPRT